MTNANTDASVWLVQFFPEGQETSEEAPQEIYIFKTETHARAAVRLLLQANDEVHALYRWSETHQAVIAYKVLNAKFVNVKHTIIYAIIKEKQPLGAVNVATLKQEVECS